jgi:hypothetical protein
LNALNRQIPDEATIVIRQDLSSIHRRLCNARNIYNGNAARFADRVFDTLDKLGAELKAIRPVHAREIDQHRDLVTGIGHLQGHVVCLKGLVP